MRVPIPVEWAGPPPLARSRSNGAYIVVENLSERSLHTSSRTREPRFALGFFLLWSLWLSAEYWLLGAQSYLRIHDNAEGAPRLD